MDCEVRQGMVAMLGHAKAAGAISPETDVEVAVQVIFTMADGLFKRRALEADSTASTKSPSSCSFSECS